MKALRSPYPRKGHAQAFCFQFDNIPVTDCDEPPLLAALLPAAELYCVTDATPVAALEAPAALVAAPVMGLRFHSDNIPVTDWGEPLPPTAPLRVAESYRVTDATLVAPPAADALEAVPGMNLRFQPDNIPAMECVEPLPAAPSAAASYFVTDATLVAAPLDAPAAVPGMNLRFQLDSIPAMECVEPPPAAPLRAAASYFVTDAALVVPPLLDAPLPTAAESNLVTDAPPGLDPVALLSGPKRLKRAPIRAKKPGLEAWACFGEGVLPPETAFWSQLMRYGLSSLCGFPIECIYRWRLHRQLKKLSWGVVDHRCGSDRLHPQLTAHGRRCFIDAANEFALGLLQLVRILQQ